jgi:hypothetical protein
MEAAGVYAIGSGVAAMAGSPASSLLVDWFSSWWNKRRLAKRVRGLVLLKGITSLCTKLTTGEVVYIDCDSLLQTLQMPKDAEELAAQQAGVKHPANNPIDVLLAHAVIKNHVINITNVFKGKIVLVSKTLDLLYALPVKRENIYFAAFSKDMEENIGVIFANEAAHHQATVEKFRVMREIAEERVYVCDNLKDLYDKTSEKFGSKRTQL